ncbi:class I SAM-dependent DNA methyltransferase [Draconibacterium sediminis]|uniref:HsdM family class I SAM-dependent methyltransferase n=1 Tax=Draconibacterium sediminis TaxID=1544798 RepID=UPI0026F144C6|nr:N-6 DNA methylase [Draconibacterium sediminis]
MIEGLKQIRTQFIRDTHLEKNLAHQLIVLSILVKYLEERKDEQGNHVFPSDFFNVYDGANSFCDVLRKKGKIVELFGELSKHFNGKIFELKPADEAILGETDLSKLAQYLDANVDKDQLVIWPLYSFEYLPVELISRIYEEFIPERKDAVYTPIHLARFMVDECMPISTPKSNFKAIDVSCGSGVFLVTVFKRMVQWWQKEQFNKTGKLINPEIDDLKAILLHSIYGVDIEADSVRLSVFSLSIALCDMLKPTEIWTKLKFEDLRKKNIYEGDFFQYLKETEKGQFDLVIGNPPFEKYNTEKIENLFKQFDFQSECKIHGNQIALLFLQKGIHLLKQNGLLALIMPSSSLLYGNTLQYRKWLFNTYNVPQIFDCTNLSSTLYDKANVATAVAFVENSKPESDNIIQIIAKRTRSTKEKLFFELDYYDFYPVPKDQAKNEVNVWKTNLLGGNSLLSTIKNLRHKRKLGQYLKEKKQKAGWFYGEGYKRDSKVKKFTDDNRAEYLTGHKMIPTSFFLEDKILGTKIEEAEYFESPRKENYKIFLAPHILIKSALGHKILPVHYFEENIGFMREIFGIHAPMDDIEELKNLTNCLKTYSDLFRFILIASSGRAGIDRSIYTLKMEDFMNLPYPVNLEELQLSNNEKIICDDIISFRLEELSIGEKAKINTTVASEEQLDEFGKVFCDSLNAIYQQDGKSFKPMEPIKTLSYTCFPFSYGNAGFNPVLASKIQEGDLSDLIENEQESVRYRRVLRLYPKDMVFLIKPNTLRYWLKSIALRDASDVMVDLINSGY